MLGLAASPPTDIACELSMSDGNYVTNPVLNELVSKKGSYERLQLQATACNFPRNGVASLDNQSIIDTRG